MYAIFQNSSKQYRVSIGQIIHLEKLNKHPGEIIEFKEVIMIINNNHTKIGTPFINGSKIIAKIISHNRKKKIKIIKFKRRKHFRKSQGHRQWFSTIEIVNIYNKE